MSQPVTNEPRTVWITGASSGIGKALALVYAREGHTVYASARSEDKLNALCAAANSLSGSIYSAPLDVTDTSSIKHFLDDRAAADDIPELCVFNAGFYEPVPFEELTLEHFQKTFDVNYLGVVRCLMATLPIFLTKSKNGVYPGHLAIVASVAGYSGLPGAAAYGSSKAALINLCESIKPSCDNYGIDLSLVNPGFVKTPMTDLNSFSMPFLVSTDSAAQRIHSGLKNRDFEVTFPRRFTWILKLLRLLPYPLYFMIAKRLT